MKILIYILLLAAHSDTWDYSPDELEEQKQAILYWEGLARKEIPKDNIGEFIYSLGKGVQVTSPSKYNVRPNTLEVHQQMKERLLAIPGHAEYYRDRINESRAEMEEARRLWVETDRSPEATARFGPAMVNMNRERRWGFETLQNLPSPETVRVLGEFLADDRGAEIPEEERKESGESPNNLLAGAALSRLGIANPPTPPMKHGGQMRDGLGTWQQWYAEIKSGRRTFSFTGDDTEYDLRGPVKRSGVGDRIRGAKRTAAVEGTETVSAIPENNRVGILPYLIGGLFLLAGLFIYIRGRQASEG
jgi:hypothetical protein